MCLLEAESPPVPYETSRQTPSLFFPQRGEFVQTQPRKGSAHVPLVSWSA